MPKLIAWDNLTEAQRKEVLARYPYWNLVPVYKSKEAWAAQHAFYITAKGQLAHRPNHCEPVFLADVAITKIQA